MRRTVYALLMLLLAVPALVEAQKRAKTKPTLEPSSYVFAEPLTPTMFTIAGPKTTVRIYGDGRVEWDKGTVTEAADEFWRELAKLTPTFQPTERIQAVVALELALSHLKLSYASLGIGMVDAVYVTPDTPVQALRRRADDIEKRDADIKAITEALDRLKTKEKRQ